MCENGHEGKITAVSLEYGVMSKYVSRVAVEDRDPHSGNHASDAMQLCDISCPENCHACPKPPIVRCRWRNSLFRNHVTFSGFGFPPSVGAVAPSFSGFGCAPLSASAECGMTQLSRYDLRCHTSGRFLRTFWPCCSICSREMGVGPCLRTWNGSWASPWRKWDLWWGRRWWTWRWRRFWPRFTFGTRFRGGGIFGGWLWRKADGFSVKGMAAHGPAVVEAAVAAMRALIVGKAAWVRFVVMRVGFFYLGNFLFHSILDSFCDCRNLPWLVSGFWLFVY